MYDVTSSSDRTAQSETPWAAEEMQDERLWQEDVHCQTTFVLFYFSVTFIAQAFQWHGALSGAVSFLHLRNHLLNTEGKFN